MSSPIGGEMLTDCLLKTLESKGIMVSGFRYISLSCISGCLCTVKVIYIL